MSLALATAIHLDWHMARPAHHQLSLGLQWHWVLAMPAFALVALYVLRVWPSRRLLASVAIIGSAILVGGVLEPLWEYTLAGAPFEWAFGVTRNQALAAYLGVGLLTYGAVLGVGVRRWQSTIAG